jgi:3-dehydroquinate synthase class II
MNQDTGNGAIISNVCGRVCVDTASLLVLGEGLLVGSFARALFLVHSECSESAYINSRPFRVNAGPVSVPQPQESARL